MSWHNPNIHSPSLEKLAAEGILLDSYYVQPTCSPSRAAFMTGQYPHREGVNYLTLALHWLGNFGQTFSQDLKRDSFGNHGFLRVNLVIFDVKRGHNFVLSF